MNWLREILRTSTRILTIGNQCLNSPTVLGLTRRDFFNSIHFENDEKICLKCCRTNSSSVCDPLLCWLPKGVLKQDLLGISKLILSEIFKLWGSCCFSKYWKFYEDFKNPIKFPWTNFGFLDNCVRIGCGKFSVLWQEYLSSVINVSRTVLIFQIWLKQKLCNLVYVRMMRKYNESGAVPISTDQ